MSRDYFRKSNKQWYELWNPRNITNFKKDKIVTPELSPSNNFTLAQSDYFYGDTVCGISLKNNSLISLLSLLGILNSKLIEFYFKSTTVPKAGGFYIYKVMFLKDIPIALPAEPIYFQLEKIQIQLLNQPIQSKVLENQIDQIVYNLYGLNEEEINIVKNSVE